MEENKDNKAEEQKLYSVKITKNKNSEVEIVGEASVELLERHRKGVIDRARQEASAPGFRKGHVPDSVLLPRLNEHEVLQEAAELTLNEIYPNIIEENKLDPLGLPEVGITKLAAGNPLGFKIRVGVIPEFKLPDYHKVATEAIKTHKAPAPEVSDKQVEETAEQILKMRAPAGGQEGKQELTDEFVKTLGPFENVADFKAKIRESIAHEATENARKALRNNILRNVVEKTNLTLPELAVERETADLHQRFLRELEQNKTTLEEYLKKVNRTEESIKGQHREHVEASLKSRMILDKIATEEKITADEKEVERNVEFLMMRNPESDKDYLKHYVTTVLTNEAVIDHLIGAELSEAEPPTA